MAATEEKIRCEATDTTLIDGHFVVAITVRVLTSVSPSSSWRLETSIVTEIRASVPEALAEKYWLAVDARYDQAEVELELGHHLGAVAAAAGCTEQQIVDAVAIAAIDDAATSYSFTH